MKTRIALIVIDVISIFVLPSSVFASGEIETTDDPNRAFTLHYQSDFSVDEDGWTGDFADYPISVLPEEWDMESSYDWTGVTERSS